MNIEFENIFEQMHKYLSLVQEIACKIVENYFHESRLENISTTILKKWQSLLSCVYFQLYIVDPTYFMLVVIFKKNTTSLCFTLIQCIYLIIKQYSWHTKKVDMLILKKKMFVLIEAKKNYKKIGKKYMHWMFKIIEMNLNKIRLFMNCCGLCEILTI